MTRPRLPAATPLSEVLANATAALKAEEKATSETLDEAVIRQRATEVPVPELPPGCVYVAPLSAHTAQDLAAIDGRTHLGTTPSTAYTLTCVPPPEPTPSDDDAIVQSAGETLPYLFSLQENFILAVGEHTRGNKALGYAEFCLRNKMAEALTEYVLQVRTEEGVDAPALVRALTVLKQAAAGHKGEK